MDITIISRPDIFPGEELAIRLLLDNGADYIHIRKPDLKSGSVAALLDKIPDRYYDRLILNGNFELLADYNLGGAHLNRRNPAPPAGFKGTVGYSCHSLEELMLRRDEMEYCLLSPIYDSISKSGYASAFSHHILADAAAKGIIDSKVIALGGITPQRVTAVKSYNFGGFAVQGYIWDSPTLDVIKEKIELLRKYADR